MESKKLTLNMSDKLKGDTFDKMAEVTKKIAQEVNEHREFFFKALLKAHNIEIAENMTKREVQGLFEKHKVKIKVKDNTEMFYIGKKLVGKWHRGYTIGFNSKGHLSASVRYEYK
jgi:hypothetical protein